MGRGCLGGPGVELARVEVDLLLAAQLEPQRGGVDDHDARVGPALDETLGVRDEEAEVLGGAPRHDVLEPVGGGPGKLGLLVVEGLVLLVHESLPLAPGGSDPRQDERV